MYNIRKVEDEKDNSQAKEYQSFYKQENVRTVAVHCVSNFCMEFVKIRLLVPKLSDQH
jgi:hypothetical protein